MTQPVDFGSCWSCVSDLDMPSTMVTGFLVVAQAIARRWSTPRGGLVGDANYGYDLSDFVSADLNTADLALIAKQAGAEAEKDERVLSCTVSISLLIDGTLNVIGTVQTAAGPFQLVGNVSSVFTIQKVTGT